jgi:uncharacterized protein
VGGRGNSELTLELAGPELLPSVAANALHLIVLPTEACNFRCTYCYEGFVLGKMKSEVVQGLKNFIGRRAPILDRLDLSWFGGEPLLALDVVEDVLRHAQTLRERYRRIDVSSDMTTNGYTLRPSVFRRLLRLGLTKYQISLDGPREHHDRMRLRCNAGPTFDRIWDNLVAMRHEPGEFRITVRLHVNAANLRDLPAFLGAYQDVLGVDPRFELFLRPLSRWGGPNDDRLPFLDDEERSGALAWLKDEAEARGVRLTQPEGDQAVCYAARMNSFVVRSDGRLGKCTLALDHPRNQVGRIRPDGEIELDLNTWLGWSRGLFSGDAQELHCPMRGYADKTGQATVGLRVERRSSAVA